MKILVAGSRWLFILSLPLLLITASIALAVNSAWLYRYGFSRYDVGRTTGLAPSETAKAAGGLIAYWNSPEEYISVTVVKDGRPMALFNRRETGHLKDVKELIQLDYRVLLAAGLYSLAFALVSVFAWNRRRELARDAVRGSALTLALMLAVGAAALVDFDRFFLQFHLISFTNDLWQLDPATDYLIMLFPQGFWFDAAVFCALSAGVLSLLTGGAGLAYLRSTRHPSHGATATPS